MESVQQLASLAAQGDATVLLGLGLGLASVAYMLLSRTSHGEDGDFRLKGNKDVPGIAGIVRADMGWDGVAKAVHEFDASFNKDGGFGDKEDAPSMVNHFYNLVTDFYEYGWGQSFHFAPRRKGQSFAASIAEHENVLGDSIKAKPGMHILDVGCGVGGPMRQIAKHTGASITGITINKYQIERCSHHNRKAGLEKLCRAVQGNFLEMPFKDNSFDGAYACEATCHSPTLEAVFQEVYRVLKPGALFASFEWVTQPAYDPNNPEHVQLIKDINYANGLPDMRTMDQALAAARKVGFEVVSHKDLAVGTEVPWSHRLARGTLMHHATHAFVAVMQALRLSPPGTKSVSTMLMKTARDLVTSEEMSVFTPMYHCVYRKPE